MLKVGEVINVQYNKEAEVPAEGWECVPERVIVPVEIPKTLNVKALDVTGLSDEEQALVAKQVQEYAEYLSHVMETTFSFADYCDHTTVPCPTSKWRTFKPHMLKEVS